MVGYSSRRSHARGDELDSWLKIDDEDDPRGRVGQQWPWDHT